MHNPGLEKTSDGDALRARGDIELAQRLLADHDIGRAIERVNRAVEQGDSARRQLLGTALRLDRRMVPGLFDTLQHAREELALDTPVELFVYPSPYFNAAAGLDNGHTFILVSSSLLEAFSAEELRFVIGHELGHELFAHHQLPVGALLSGGAQLSAAQVLELFAWQRYAEISCDRVGVRCAGGFEPAALALFKLASGLQLERVQVDITAFLEQAGELERETERLGRADGDPRSDWFASHPFSPLRLRAAQLYTRSIAVTPGGISVDALEAQIDDLMSIMRPSYLQERSDVAEAMRRLLFAGGVAVAAAGTGVSEAKLRALEDLLGSGSLPPRVEPERIIAELPPRIERVREIVPTLRRIQLCRDLCLIAHADGEISAAELAVLDRILKAVGVNRRVMDCNVCAASAGEARTP